MDEALKAKRIFVEQIRSADSNELCYVVGASGFKVRVVSPSSATEHGEVNHNIQIHDPPHGSMEKRENSDRSSFQARGEVARRDYYAISDPAIRRAVERQHAAFRRMLPELLKTNRGEYVAIQDGRVIDRDANRGALVRRASQRYKEGHYMSICEVTEETTVYFSEGV